MIRAVLSIGSNMADRRALLASVPEGLTANPDTRVEAVSSVYSTAPWGVTDQAEFLNAAVIVQTKLDPAGLLDVAHELEDAAERRRVRHWGPRTLDVDIVQVTADGREVLSADPVLTLPHPHAWHRAFVLVPWLEVEPEARLAGAPVTGLLADLDPSEVSGIHRQGPLRFGRGVEQVR